MSFHKIHKKFNILIYGLLIINSVKFCAKSVKKDISMTDRIVAKTELAAKKFKNILVIDDFKDSSIDIDADFIGCYSWICDKQDYRKRFG